MNTTSAIEPSPLDRAIACFESQAELARQIALITGKSCTPQAVQKWLAGQVPADRCRAIEQLTGGKVTCQQLRPDVFGEAFEAGQDDPDADRIQPVEAC